VTDAATPSNPTRTDTVQVQAADGTADVLVARPQTDGPVPAVLVYTDAYGIRPAVHAHAQRLASHGYLVVTPNVF
jgi:carboxymethylenebutenolidase